MNDEQNTAAEAATLLNTSGIAPLEYKVLVLPDEVEAITKKGIYKADETIDAEKRAICLGTLVANSPWAFNFDAGMTALLPGTRVLYAKYAGGEIKGPADGRTYRIMNDKDILGEVTHEGQLAGEDVPILHWEGAAA